MVEFNGEVMEGDHGLPELPALVVQALSAFLRFASVPSTPHF